eukprot:scaffold119367_cov24-Phaeocystis_antarctica.AAC.1
MGKRARTARRNREFQGVHSGGEMGYQGANIWPTFANEVCVLTLVLPRSPVGDGSAPRVRDSHQLVVCTRPQAQIVGLGLL